MQNIVNFTLNLKIKIIDYISKQIPITELLGIISMETITVNSPHWIMIMTIGRAGLALHSLKAHGGSIIVVKYC